MRRTYPPPKGYKQPELRDQLRAGTRALLLSMGLIDTLIGIWLWRVARAGCAGSGATTAIGLLGLALINAVCAGLVWYARRRP